MSAFGVLALVALAVAAAFLLVPLWSYRRRGGTWSIAGLGAAAATPAVAWLLYSLVTTWNPEAERQALVGLELTARLAARLKESPDDVAGWRLLGQTYVVLERYDQAGEAFREAYNRTPAPDNELKLALAEALGLSDRAAFAGEAGRLIEEVLAAEPANREALWYGGLVALDHGRFDDAHARWSRLLELVEPADRLAEVLRQQLAELAAVRGEVAARQAVAGTGPLTAAGPTIRVKVGLGAGRAVATLGPQATLFVFARIAASPMPIAAKRLPAGNVPGEFTLTDADLLPPGMGRSLGDFPAFAIGARLSASGQATEQSGDWYAEPVTMQPADGAIVELVIDRVVP